MIRDLPLQEFVVRTTACLILALIMVASSPVWSQEIPYIDALHAPDEKDITWSTKFKIVPTGQAPDNYWVIRIKDNKIVGYAPWDRINRRWTLFNWNGEYRGIIQATVGQQLIKHEKVDIWYQWYTQYVWYFSDRASDNIYRGVMIASLGGRPKTETLPKGELGGSLDLYQIGYVPGRPYEPAIFIDPAKRPMGIDISIVPRLR
jgi:hypothetical protein